MPKSLHSMTKRELIAEIESIVAASGDTRQLLHERYLYFEQTQIQARQVAELQEQLAAARQACSAAERARAELIQTFGCAERLSHSPESHACNGVAIHECDGVGTRESDGVATHETNGAGTRESDGVATHETNGAGDRESDGVADVRG